MPSPQGQPQAGQRQNQATIGQVDNWAEQVDTRTGQAPSLHDMNHKDRSDVIRPISTILDPEPALLPHQRALAEWMAVYYVTPLAQVAVKMLPPGLVQRSKVVLRLINDEDLATYTTQDQQEFTRLHALIGFLLADGEIEVERLKEMLGPKQAKEILQEAQSSRSLKPPVVFP